MIRGKVPVVSYTTAANVRHCKLLRAHGLKNEVAHIILARMTSALEAVQ